MKTLKKLIKPFIVLSLFFVLALVLKFKLTNLKSVLGATYTWVQTDWSDGLDVGSSFPFHPDNVSGWSRYSAKDSGLSAGTELTLTTTSYGTSQTTNTDFDAGTKSSVTVTGTGTSGVVTLAYGRPDSPNCSGTDHAGADWTVTNGDAYDLDTTTANIQISGEHCNVGAFLIPAGRTVYIKAYNGTSFGQLKVVATSITIQGSLLGDTRGYLGGNGGGGATSDSGPNMLGGNGVSGTNIGSYGGVGGSGGTGQDYYTGPGGWGCWEYYEGGNGGSSVGSTRGTISGTDIDMGGGGGGGGGSGVFINGCDELNTLGQNGTAGGNGGGSAYLYSTGIITIDGTVSMNGGNGGSGGSNGGGDGGGGAGASGGGILINGVGVTISGILRANGGLGGNGFNSGGSGGGGRIKLFGSTISTVGSTITATGANAGTIYNDSDNPSIYLSSGNLISSAININNDSYSTLTFNVTKPSNTDIKFQLRSATTEGGLSDATWYGPTGTDDYYTSSGTEINSVHDGHSWIQYKAYLSNTVNTVTPTLSDLTINYNAVALAASSQTSNTDFNAGTKTSITVSGTGTSGAVTLTYDRPNAPSCSGTDHAGADWTVTNGDAYDLDATATIQIAGEHCNIGAFSIPSGRTVYIKAYNSTSFGQLKVVATSITIEGSLLGDARGYAGGSGGSGGYGSGSPGGVGYSGVYVGSYGSAGGSGGAATGGGGGGGSSVGSTRGTSNGTDIAMGGGGGGGGGGEGYDECVDMWDVCYQWASFSGNSGSNGGAGGGSSYLYSSGNITIGGTVSMNGGNGGNGYGGGGAGASGGGILVNGENVTVSGTLRANGGAGGSATNNGASGGGGRIKLFGGLITTTGSTITATGHNAGTIYNAGENSTSYLTSGNLISSAINIPNSSFTSLDFTITKPSNTDLKFQLRSATTQEGLSAATWYGPTGTSDYYTDTGTEINSVHDGHSWIQFKAFLSNTVNTATPTLSDITINYTYPSQTLTSSPYNSSSDANILSDITWTGTTQPSTEIKFQLRTAATSGGLSSSDFVGPDGTTGSYFTAASGTGESIPSALADGVNDQWIQYKVWLTSTGAQSPTLSDITLTYVVNSPPELDATYQTNGFGVTAGEAGFFNFLYKVRDPDTAEGSPSNQYKLWPTFYYSLDNGSTWTQIADSSLTGPDSTTSLTLVDNSSYTTDATVWNAAADVPNTYNTAVKIRMVLDDHEAANNTATITSEAFTLDTKTPVVGTPDGGGSGININNNTTTSLATDKTSNRNVTLYFAATDDSSLQLKYSPSADFTGAAYQDYVSSIGYTLPSGDGSKRVYVKFKDYYGNESEAYSDLITLDTTAPTAPGSLYIQDISNPNTSEYRLFLNWAKSTANDWVNYKIYKSTDGSTFDLLETISNINTNYSIVTGVGLTAGLTYSFKVNALDDVTNESVGSTISQTTGGNPRDLSSPTISNVQTSALTTTSVTITWTTNEISNSTVLYSIDESYSSTQGSTGYATSHTVTLSGLTPGTTYNFKVRSTDAAGNSTESDASDFTTNAADTTGPIISAITAGTLTESSAIITFTTGELANSFVEYSTTSGFISGNILGQNDSTLSHSVKLSSLTATTTYYYKVHSKDALGNETVSSQSSFTTTTSTSDTTAPTISSITASNIKYNTATISFTTSEAASSFVEFGRTTSYGRIYGQNNSVTDHTVTLPYDLKPDSIYYYRVRSKDAVGNEAISAGSTFTTAANPNDLAAPIITSISTSEPGQNSVIITWTTNEVADSFIGFSEDLSYVQEQGNPLMVTSHSVTLVGLKPSTKYYFKVKSTDPSSNIATDNNSSQGYSFVTANGATPPTIFANQIKNVGTSSALIYWETNVNANSYVEYGLDQSYGNWAGINDSTDEHSIQLSGLLSAATYHFRVRSKSSANAEAVSANFSFTTSGIAVTAATSVGTTSTDSETSILDSIKAGSTDFLKKVLNIFPDTAISEADFVATLNSMAPKIVSSPAIEAGNITVDPGVDKITITWTTDKKSSSLVAYAADADYNAAKTDPYTTTLGNPDEEVTSHSVEITNLNPNTLYHYQVRSKTAFGNWTKSSDFTFTTQSMTSEVRDFKFNTIGERSVDATWVTSFESRAMIDVIDTLTNKTVFKTEEVGFSKTHSFKTTELQVSTNYQVKITTVAKDGTTSAPSIYPFATSTSSNPPEITNVRISNALIPGTIEQVQTIISWKTDKPSTSRILYDEGLTQNLNQATSLDKSLVFDHIMVTTVLKPGKVYKFKAESMDSNGATAVSKDYIIMTPKAQESVVNLIIDNFTQSFSFIRGGKN